jgi:hypothetical protein
MIERPIFWKPLLPIISKRLKARFRGDKKNKVSREYKDLLGVFPLVPSGNSTFSFPPEGRS